MIRVQWDISEAVVLLAVYMENEKITMDMLKTLSGMYNRRANTLGIICDDKFRNISGLKMQLACIKYVVTGGREGMPNAGQIFYQAYDLYCNDPDAFKNIRERFYDKFS